MNEQKAVKTQAERKLESIKESLLQLRADRISELNIEKLREDYNEMESYVSFLRGKIQLLNTLLSSDFDIPEIEF